MGRRKELRSEFEVPPHTKMKVTCTVDSKLLQEMRLIHEQEVKKAVYEDRSEPDWSNTLEMLFRKGVKSYKSSASLVE